MFQVCSTVIQYFCRLYSIIRYYFSSVQFSHSVMSDPLQPHGLQHTRLFITNSQSLLKLISIESVLASNHLISSISSHPPSPAFSFSQHQGLFQRVNSLHQVTKVLGVSVSAIVLLVNIQAWFLLGLTGLISLQSKGLSRVFSNTTVQKYQFFATQLSLWSNSHSHTWQLEKP